MTKIITIPLHIGDFLSGTMHMDTLEKGAYIMLLLSHYQVGEKGLKDNDKYLSRITGLTLRKWKIIKPVLAEKFDIKNGFWVNEKCQKVLQNISDISNKNRAKALKRHKGGYATALQEECQPKPKPKPKPKKEIKDKKTKAKKALFLEDDLPDFINSSILNDFIQMRKDIKKPLTEKAMNIFLNKCHKLHGLGNDINELIENAILNNWASIYEDKNKKGNYDNGTKSTNYNQSESTFGNGSNFTQADRDFLAGKW